jgi:hypothetical protein
LPLTAAIALVAVVSPLAGPSLAFQSMAGAGLAPPVVLSQAQPLRLARTGVFDPAATDFNSLMSYDAMSVLAPFIFGDFQSPSDLSFPSMASGMGAMPQITGFDPAVSTMLNGVLQQGLLPAGGAAAAETFAVGSSEDDGAPIIGAVQPGDSTPDWLGAGTPAEVAVASGIRSTCEDSEVADKLQAGGKFWDSQQGRTAPVQVPPSVFSRIEVGDPLGGLGPRGNPTNLPPPGLAGAWCRPGPTPFYQSSPIENPLVQIGFGAAFIGLLVFWLSRGIRLPA